jgi:mannose-6-phosphate isomerase-like protein (cupin superfamily)
MCHLRIHASQQTARPFDHFVEDGLSPQAASGANTGFAGMSSALGLVATGSAGAANDREEIMPVVDPRIAGKPVPRISKETMEHECVARVNNVKALDVAFLDQRIPRYERDIINMVGMGVTENAALMPNVKEGAVAFSVTYVRAKSGKGAALHRHATEEVFIPVKGRWQIFWLEGEEERSIDLDEGDVVNVPIGVYRGFRSLTDAHDALLMAIIGGPDAGKVDWHPSVLAEARKTGLSVDDAGNLIIERPAA